MKSGHLDYGSFGIHTMYLMVGGYEPRSNDVGTDIIPALAMHACVIVYAET